MEHKCAYNCAVLCLVYGNIWLLMYPCGLIISYPWGCSRQRSWVRIVHKFERDSLHSLVHYNLFLHIDICEILVTITSLNLHVPRLSFHDLSFTNEISCLHQTTNGNLRTNNVMLNVMQNMNNLHACGAKHLSYLLYHINRSKFVQNKFLFLFPCQNGRLFCLRQRCRGLSWLAPERHDPQRAYAR